MNLEIKSSSKGLSKIISDPKVDKKEKQKEFCEMDKVLRIAKPAFFKRNPQLSIKPNTFP